VPPPAPRSDLPVPSATPKTQIAVVPSPPEEPTKPEPAPYPEAPRSLIAANITPPAPTVPAANAIPKSPPVSVGPVSPPKVLAQAPMVVPDSLKKSILGDVIITLNLEIDVTGQVTKATLAGKASKSVQRLEGAALE